MIDFKEDIYNVNIVYNVNIRKIRLEKIFNGKKDPVILMYFKMKYISKRINSFHFTIYNKTITDKFLPFGKQETCLQYFLITYLLSFHSSSVT